MFVCLGGFISLDIFSLIWRRHLSGEEIQILTFARLSYGSLGFLGATLTVTRRIRL